MTLGDKVPLPSGPFGGPRASEALPPYEMSHYFSTFLDVWVVIIRLKFYDTYLCALGKPSPKGLQICVICVPKFSIFWLLVFNPSKKLALSSFLDTLSLIQRNQDIDWLFFHPILHRVLSFAAVLLHSPFRTRRKRKKRETFLVLTAIFLSSSVMGARASNA